MTKKDLLTIRTMTLVTVVSMFLNGCTHHPQPQNKEEAHCNIIVYEASEKLDIATDWSEDGLRIDAFNVNILSHEFSDGIGTIQFSADVKEIGLRAFKGNKKMTSITIPKSVKVIDSGAFEGCSGLRHIVIPKNVESISHRAFSGCSGLTRIDVSYDNANYDSRNGCNAIVESSSNILVAGCQNTVIPNSVVALGDYAFDGCTTLASIKLPKSVTSIGCYAFQGCSNVASIEVDSGNVCFDSRNGCNAIIKTATNTLVVACKNTIIPTSVTSIGNDAYRTHPDISSVDIPNSVTSIGDAAFEGCSDLTNMVIPGSVTNVGIYVFLDCKSLTNVTISSNLSSIGDGMFKGCTSLSTLIVPGFVTRIEDDAFNGCSGLTHIKLPGSVTSIGYGAFHDCSNLVSINIPASVTNIGEEAFYGCLSLTDIAIPKSITKIGRYAFDRCDRLKKIRVNWRQPPSVYSDTFVEFNFDSCSLIVPRGSEELYKKTYPWSEFKNIKPVV